MQHEHDYTQFIQPINFEEYLYSLTNSQRHALREFYAEDPALLETSHHRTANGIFVTIHQDYSAEKSIDPRYHAVVTCRRLGGIMLREACDIHDVQFTPTLIGGHHSLEKIITLKGRETSNRAVVMLGKNSLWVEQNQDGYAAHYPLLPFDPKQLVAPTKE